MGPPHRLSINLLRVSPRAGGRPAGLACGRREAADPVFIVSGGTPQGGFSCRFAAIHLLYAGNVAAACPLLPCMATARERPQAREAAMKSLAEMARPFPRNPRKTWRSHFFEKLRRPLGPPLRAGEAGGHGRQGLGGLRAVARHIAAQHGGDRPQEEGGGIGAVLAAGQFI